ncbi:hypothetical protein [Blastopirellula marina]|uniref:Uncharacterized protein n=1 Tax=Blastopirellula marina TaxID=124 RepID=A0A2S8GVZ1_9BACT|nr:hypothetical protein [Blastopirellula marina]PQO48214.1 hypothetical protein C5Y93_00590 [Blastopirellula marina]
MWKYVISSLIYPFEICGSAVLENVRTAIQALPTTWEFTRSWLTPYRCMLSGEVLLLLGAVAHFGCEVCHCLVEGSQEVSNAVMLPNEPTRVLLIVAMVHVLGYLMIVGAKLRTHGTKPEDEETT